MTPVADSLEWGAALRDPMEPRTFVVARTMRETADTFTLQLEPQDPLDRIHFKPGQFNMVYAFGVGEVPLSISGSPGDGSCLIHTIREVGLATRALHRMAVGEPVGIRGPFGTPWPVEEARDKDVVLVAGGIGLAPLRPALYHVLEHREQYARVIVLYGTRTPQDIVFAKELAKWRAQFDLDVLVTVDRADEKWRGTVGVVTKLVHRAPFDPDKTLAMVCGPEIMMRFSVAELRARGVPTRQTFVSMERNMKCGIGLCGHCQLRGHFICKDGPVYRFDEIEPVFLEHEL